MSEPAEEDAGREPTPETLLFRALLRPEPARAHESAAAWWADHVATTAELARPIDRAIAGAAIVDRLGYAFAGGYAAALAALVPALDRDRLASLAATEEGGAHPRAIATTLSRQEGDRWVLRGRKRWVTLGPEGGTLLVVARLAAPPPGAPADRPTLRVVRVDARAPGVTIEPLAHMPFVPEIPHASVVLDGVAVRDDDLLPGDGYDAYLKPFRTIEDVHVHAALLAWLLAIAARAGWPRALSERLLAVLAATRALAASDPSAPETHVALAGAIAETRAVIDACEPAWERVDPALRARWQRDRALLDVASKARAARLERAWARLGRECAPT